MNEILVGNIGSVYYGSDDIEAARTFNEYKDQSIRLYGRAAGESVVWMRDGEPYKEFVGEMNMTPEDEQ